MIDPSKLYTSLTKVNIKCNKCSNIFDQAINAHVVGKGCRYCAGNMPYTYEKFIENATEKHKGRYDYSLIDPGGSFKMIDKVLIICNRCDNKFKQKIGNHIHNAQGCPDCPKSKGELSVIDYLGSKNISCVTQFILPSLLTRRFDSMVIISEDRKFIIEFDGKQHFKLSNTFHKSIEKFENDKNIDVIKTVEAIKAGYTMIRIAYNIKNLDEFLHNALWTDYNLYVSDTNIYREHIDKVLELLPDVEANI